MSKSFKELAGEFGFLGEEVKNAEADVANQLDKAMKMDEVESVTFGLETDDGKIVKVYVKADEADDFEKALSKKLGSEDSIEAALNDMSKNFDIIDVEWPEDDEDDEEDDDTDKPNTDGSESMNSQVYDNPKDPEGGSKDKGKSALKPKMEGLSLGERFTYSLIEANEKKSKEEGSDDPSASIADRLKDSNEELVYHAILELGVPEHALNKSPFKTAILDGIRKKARELGRSHHLRTSVRTFVKKSVDESIESGENLIPLNENSPADAFMDTITNLINWLDASGNKRYAEQLLNSQQYKALMQRAKSELTQVINSNIQTKLNALNKVLQTNMHQGNSTPLEESMNAKQFTDFFGSFMAYIDPSDNKQLVENLQKCTPYKQYITGIQSSLSSKTGGMIGQKLTDLQAVLDQVYKSKSQQNQNPQSSAPSMQSSQGPTPTTEAVVVEDNDPNAGAKWEIMKDDEDNTVLTYGTLKATLNDEAIEALNKAIKNRTVLTVKDMNEKDKYIFSPRGKTVLVKKVGFGNLQGVMKESDVEKLLGLTDEA